MGGCDHDHESYPRRLAQQEVQAQPELKLPSPVEAQPASVESEGEANPAITQPAESNETAVKPPSSIPLPARSTAARYLHTGRDGGGTSSGANTPHELSDDEASDMFKVASTHSLRNATKKAPQRKATSDDIQRWAQESGMGNGTKADALGDEPEEDEVEDEDELSSAEQDLDQAEEEDKGLRGSVY